jgi:hypothetical protein
LPQPQSSYSADALVTLFLVLLMALTSVAAEGGMGDTTFTAIISWRVISMVADSMEVDFTEAAGMAAIGRREEELTDSRESRSNTKHGQAHHIQLGGLAGESNDQYFVVARSRWTNVSPF